MSEGAAERVPAVWKEVSIVRRLREILRHFAQMPRGYAADGRMLGLATATAIESSRQLKQDEPAQARPVAVPEQRH